MVPKYKCVKCGEPGFACAWNSFITYKSNIEVFCARCFRIEVQRGNWMPNCGYCKHFKTEVCFDCKKSSKLEWSGIKRSELKNRFGKFLNRMRKELCGITVTIKDGEWIIPNYDLRRGLDIAIRGYSRLPFD